MSCPGWMPLNLKVQYGACMLILVLHCVTQLKFYTVDKLSSTKFCCLSVSGISNTWPNLHFFQCRQAYKPFADPAHYHLIPSSTNLYWPSTSQYRHILTQYHQVPPIIYHLVRQSSANWIISLFTTHLMSHAQYTWPSSGLFFNIALISKL